MDYSKHSQELPFHLLLLLPTPPLPLPLYSHP